MGTVNKPNSDKILIELRLFTGLNLPPYHVQALVDSGADTNLISESIIKKLDLRVTKKSHPIAIFGADGCSLQPAGITEEIYLTFSHQLSAFETHVDRDCHFDILKSPIYDVILGLPWLRRHQPQIDWSGSKVLFTSKHCQNHCLDLSPQNQPDQHLLPSSTTLPALPAGPQPDPPPVVPT